MLSLEIFHTWWLYTHIASGFLGLIAFWAPIFSKKGSAAHKRAGKVFVACAYVTATTAIVSSAWALAGPVGFMTSRGVALSAAQDQATQIRFLFALLFFLSVGVLVGLQEGTRLVRFKDAGAGFPARRIKALYVAYGVSGACLAAYGAWSLVSDRLFGGYVLCLALGIMGVSETRTALRLYSRPWPTRMTWWYRHMEAMIGCGVGFHTAFLVFGARSLAATNWLPPETLLIAIFLPAAIGVPAAHLWIRHYKRRFGELA